MAAKDARVDAYIAKSSEFAKPILESIRNAVHKASPKIDETMKWGFPNFEFKGILCSMASFKQHCAFGFWKSQLMDDPDNILKSLGEGAMGNLGPLKSVKDLPPQKTMVKYVTQAMKLNDDGVKIERKRKTKSALVIPDYFIKELKKNTGARKVFNDFTESQKREYIDWITEAKREETRNDRIKISIEWIAEGKHRNWKYMKK